AAAEIRLSLLSGAPLAESRELICRRACELLAGQAAVLVSRTGPGLVIVAAAGQADPAHLIGLGIPPAPRLAGRRLDAGAPVRLRQLRGEVDTSRLGAIPLGPAVGAPARSERGVSGALSVIREPGRAEFTDQEVVLAQGMADQAALAAEMAKARED